MTTIRLDGGRVTFRDGKVGTGEDCCCDQETPECPESCPDLEVSVTVSYCGITAAVVMGIPGNTSTLEMNGSDFIVAFAAIECGDYGPNGERGWLLSVGGCGVCDGNGEGDAWEGFIEQTADGCPVAGNVNMETVASGLFTVTAVVQ